MDQVKQDLTPLGLSRYMRSSMIDGYIITKSMENLGNKEEEIVLFGRYGSLYRGGTFGAGLKN